MDVNYINPFLKALQYVMQMVFGIQPEFGKVYLKKAPFQGYTVNLKVNGEVDGVFALVMNGNTAKKIVTKMLGQEIEQMNDMAISAISELGNMIIENACTLYYQKGLHINIFTPEVVVGETEDFKKPAVICVPIQLNNELGNLNVAIAM